jgi:hypothetical protein
MVMLRLDHTFVSDINGRFGGGHFKYDKCGAHFQQNPRRGQKISLWQKIDRDAYDKSMNLWRHMDSDDARLQIRNWARWAKAHPIKNKKGELKIMSAYNAFMSVNMDRILSGKEPLMSPYPEEPPKLCPPTMYVVISSPGTKRIILVFPQEMVTDPDYTPDISDFIINEPKWRVYGTGTVHWLNRYTLYIDLFDVLSVKDWTTCWYRQGGNKLSTRDREWYHSFVVKFDNTE